MRDQLISAPRTAQSGRSTLGDRVRQLRIAKGLTQTDLAGERFSKEYVSQIERGKTRPTGETIEPRSSRTLTRTPSTSSRSSAARSIQLLFRRSVSARCSRIPGAG